MKPKVRTIHCTSCSYPLGEIGGSCCPECGRAFDRDDPRTYATSPTSLRWRRVRPLLIGVGVGAIIGCSNLAFVHLIDAWPKWMSAVLFILLVFVNGPWYLALVAGEQVLELSGGEPPLLYLVCPIVWGLICGALFALRPRRRYSLVVLILLLAAIHGAVFAYAWHWAVTNMD